LSERTVGQLFIWKAKRTEKISKKNHSKNIQKYSDLRFAIFDKGLAMKVVLGPSD